MPARATKPVVQIEVPEGGIQVVAPHQHHDAAAEPDAFRVARRTINRLRRLNELVGLSLAVLGCGVRRALTGRGRLAGLVLGPKIATLSDSAADANR